MKQITDPVSGFVYPASWVAKCLPQNISLVESGFAVLTSDGKVLRRGFTTGSTAASAVYAACASLCGLEILQSPIHLPCGITADIPSSGMGGIGTAKKFSGDYPSDITAGICFHASAVVSESISITAGFGIGRFVRDTPRYKKGDAAISPPAMQSILIAAEEGCKAAGISGAEILLTIPDGKRIGEQTLNPRIGVAGGISVVGTTGFVEPWDDHLSETMEERISSASAVVITTGRIGLRYSRLLFPDHEAILAGSKIAEALSASASCRSVVLCGLPGLILRYFNPETATSRGFATVEELIASPSGSAALEEELGYIKEKYPDIRVCIISRDGKVIGETS